MGSLCAGVIGFLVWCVVGPAAFREGPKVPNTPIDGLGEPPRVLRRPRGPGNNNLKTYICWWPILSGPANVPTKMQRSAPARNHDGILTREACPARLGASPRACTCRLARPAPVRGCCADGRKGTTCRKPLLFGGSKWSLLLPSWNSPHPPTCPDGFRRG